MAHVENETTGRKTSGSGSWKGIASLRGKRPYAILLAAIMLGSLAASLTPAAPFAQAHGSGCSTPEELYKWTHSSSATPASLTDIDYIEIRIMGLTNGWQNPDGYALLDGLVIAGADKTENNAVDWKAVGGVAPTFVSTTSEVRMGTYAIKYSDPNVGGLQVIQLQYPKQYNANWNLNSNSNLSFWIKYADDTPAYTEDAPYALVAVLLYNSVGNYLRYDLATGSGPWTGKTNFMAGETWNFVTLPLTNVRPCFSVSTQNSLTVPLTTTFSYSAEPGGGITQYKLDADGDGAWDATSSTAGNLEWTYTTPGLYEARLHATDTKGEVWAKTLEIAAHAPAERPLKVKVGVVVYDYPGGTPTHAQTESKAVNYTAFIRNATGGRVDPVINFTRHNYFVGPNMDYVANGNGTLQLIADNQLDARIKNGSIDVVWANPYGHSEGNCAGPGTGGLSHANGGCIGTTDSGRGFMMEVIPKYGDYSESSMLHSIEEKLDTAHHASATYGAPGEVTHAFSRTHEPAFGPLPAGVGRAHVACNGNVDSGTSGYADATPRPCTAEKWRNYPYDYPYDSTETTLISRANWGCDQILGHSWPFGPCANNGNLEGAYIAWYLQHLPQNPGRNGDKLNNWYKYIWDFPSYPESVLGAAIPNAHITAPRANTTVTAGVPYTFKGHGHDVDSSLGLDKVKQLVWSWGDGTPNTVVTTSLTAYEPSSVSHTFSNAGTYEVTLRAIDVLDRYSSGVSIETRTITVNPGAPPDLYFVCPPTTISYGTESNCANMQSSSDGNAVATLTEALFGGGQQLLIDHNSNGVGPTGTTHTLNIRGRSVTTDEYLRIFVKNPGQTPLWNQRLTILATDNTLVTKTYALTASEWNNGQPAIRFYDSNYETTTSTWEIEHAKVVTT